MPPGPGRAATVRPGRPRPTGRRRGGARRSSPGPRVDPESLEEVRPMSRPRLSGTVLVSLSLLLGLVLLVVALGLKLREYRRIVRSDTVVLRDWAMLGRYAASNARLAEGQGRRPKAVLIGD